MIFIDSKENNTFKKIKKLRTKKYRDSEKKFLAEGVKFLDFDTVPEIIFIDENYSENSEILNKIEKFKKSQK